MGELPHIPPSHPCRRKGHVAQHREGNWDRSWAAGEDDGLPVMTTRCLEQLHRGTGGRTGLLLPRDRSSWAHQTMRNPWDTGAMRHERAAGTHPASALRQAWGSVPAPRGTASYARNVPNESGLDCGRSGRRAAQELTRELGQSQSCCNPLIQSPAEPQWLRVLWWHWCRVGVGRATCRVLPRAPRGAAFLPLGFHPSERICLQKHPSESRKWVIWTKTIRSLHREEEEHPMADRARAEAHPNPYPSGLSEWE